MTQNDLPRISFDGDRPLHGTEEEPQCSSEEDFGTPEEVLSPLRYPGSKRQLIPFFRGLLAANPPRVECFVEVFAGGASVSLHLASLGLVDTVVLAEADPLVYAFWKVACTDPIWLVDALWEVEVSLETWESLRARPGRSLRDRALACLVLNRTSFSGILHPRAGPIGGKAQASAYKIDCRFYRATLEQRIRAVGKLYDNGRIANVWNTGFAKTIERACQRAKNLEGLLFYCDPPFFAKAQQLYRYSFDSAQHRALAGLLGGLDRRWVLSYDYHPEIVALYQAADASHHLHLVELSYKASPYRRATDELLVTNLPTILRTSPRG